MTTLCWRVELNYIGQTDKKKRMLSIPMTYKDARAALEGFERRGYRGRLVEIVAATEQTIRARTRRGITEGGKPL